MKLETININDYSFSQLETLENELFHKKSLPFLSVVQSVEGSYGIGIDTPNQEYTGEMGAFIAPRDKLQFITHYTNPSSKVMRAHWIFLDVTVNSVFRLEDLYDFPVILPNCYNNEVYHILQNILQNKSLCADLSEIYKLIDILLKIGTQKPPVENLMNDIKVYINENYKKKITPNRLASSLGISVPTLFRKFQAYFNCTPANYINNIRLQNASVLLEKTNKYVKEIAMEVGFDDVYYFSKLFKNKYDKSPLEYRRSLPK